MLGATGFVEMQWAVVEGVRQKPSPGLMGACPGCGGEVRAKCGKQITWHWAHVVAECDSWSEGESEWHLKWKYRFPEEMQEVSMGPHRADVKGDAAVLEVQASPMDVDTLAERENFYGEMLWMLKGKDFQPRFEIGYKGFGEYWFAWKTPRKCWGYSTRRILVDFSFGIFEIIKFNNPGVTPFTGVGKFISPAEIYQSVCGSDILLPGEASEWRKTSEVKVAKRLQHENLLDSIEELILCFAKIYEIYQLRRYWTDFIQKSNISRVPTWLEGVDRSMRRNFHIQVWTDLEKYQKEYAEWRSVLEAFDIFCQKREEQQRENERLYAAERERREQELQQEYDRQRIADEAERGRIEKEAQERERQRIASELEWQRERDEAARISAEKRRQVEIIQKLKAEKEERYQAARKLSVQLLRQSKAFALESQRGDFVDRIQLIRPRPATVYGSWSTHDLQDLLASLNAARERLGHSEWSRLAGVK